MHFRNRHSEIFTLIISFGRYDHHTSIFCISSTRILSRPQLEGAFGLSSVPNIIFSQFLRTVLTKTFKPKSKTTTGVIWTLFQTQSLIMYLLVVGHILRFDENN